MVCLHAATPPRCREQVDELTEELIGLYFGFRLPS